MPTRGDFVLTGLQCDHCHYELDTADLHAGWCPDEDTEGNPTGDCRRCWNGTIVSKPAA